MNWKILVWIFIALFVIETLVILLVFSSRLELQEQETECSYNVCTGYYTYLFDDLTSVCYCYDMEGEVATTKYMGGE